MITHRSLTNRRRRLPELRRTHMKFRSLKRARFAELVWSKKLGDSLAIAQLFEETAGFIECTFSNHLDNSSAEKRAMERMVRALRIFAQECMRSSVKQKSIKPSVIRVLSSATTNLYQTTRYSEIHWDCDEQWQRLGLCCHAIFE